MNLVSTQGGNDPASVYIARTSSGKLIEFVESVQPPIPREEKWVLIVSTLYGCPVGCPICDAGQWYDGKLSKEEIFDQIDYMVVQRYPNRVITPKKFKIQFARMGDPAFNPAVLEVIKELPSRYDAPGFLPSLSTVAPNGTDNFFDRLIDLRRKTTFKNGFQMQFSIHTTDRYLRDKLIPVNKWDFEKIALFAEKFFTPDDKKISLNFALAENSPIDINVLKNHFDPDKFLIKLTPVNPTESARANNIINGLDEYSISDKAKALIDELEKEYQVIVSIGDTRENRIGSNCGQYVQSIMKNKVTSSVTI